MADPNATRSSGPLFVAVVLVLLLLPVWYASSYLAFVKPRGSVASANDENLAQRSTDYRWDSNWATKLFWPLEQVDRELRPEFWLGIYPTMRHDGGFVPERSVIESSKPDNSTDQ